MSFRQKRTPVRAKIMAHVFTWAMVLPIFTALLTATAAADGSGEDLRAIVTYADFDQIPSDSYFAARGVDVTYRFGAIPALVVIAPLDALNGLRSHAAFVELEFDHELSYFLNTATISTRAAYVWGESTTWRTDAAAKNVNFPALRLPDGTPIDGRGITVGVVDSGVNALHPDLWYAPLGGAGAAAGIAPKVKACVNAPTVPAADQPYCDETVGHGTHVAGIVAGNGWAQKNGLAAPLSNAPYVGAAPGAQLVASGMGAAILVIDATSALDWMYTVRNTYDIQVVTNSWGDVNPACTASVPSTSNSIIGITKKLVDANIPVLFAAGNYDTLGAKTWPSTYSRNPYPGVISVANYDDRNTGTRDGQIASGSSDGCVKPESSGDYVWTWPDVAAPGTSIVSTASYTGAVVPGLWNPPFYASAGGTSMATPHVAGIVALMKQAYPAITPAQVERILIETATPWTDGVSSRSVTGTSMWGTNNAATGWAAPETCKVTPTDAAKALAGDTSVNTKFPLFTTLPNPDLYTCRDYRRGAGLVDAYAAVERAIALRGDITPPGDPEVRFTSPAANEAVTAGPIDVSGIVDRVGGTANEPPTASLVASTLSGTKPLTVEFTLTGSDTDGSIASWSLNYGDATAPATGTGALPATLRTHTYTNDGTYAAILTVFDNEGANGTASVSIRVGGMPVPDGTILGETHAYNTGGVGASNVVALVTGTALNDAVPKYVPGETVGIQSRSVASENPQVVIDQNTPAALFIYAANGTQMAGPIPMTGGVENPTLGSGFSYNAGQFTIPVDWSGKYYLAPRLTVAASEYWVKSVNFNGLKPIEVIGAGITVPGIPSTEPGSDEGHSIGDADNDGLTPMGEIQWADVSTTATEVKAVIKLGQVPPQPAGDSPFLYGFVINGIDFESYIFGFPTVWDSTNNVLPTGATTTWDALTNTVSITIPRAYLAGLTPSKDCPCAGHVEARIGEGLQGGLQTVDRAPNAGSVPLAAMWQPGLGKGLTPAVKYGSEADPEATDVPGDSVGNLAWMDITKIWVSRENATEFDITLKVSDMSAMPPSVPGLGTNYQVEFCLDNNGAGGYTGAKYTGVSAICYRASATSGVLGPTFGVGVIQKDANGSCGFADMSLGGAFNTAASTVTWKLPRALLNVKTISGAVGDCSGLTPPTRTGGAVIDGTKLSRLNAGTGHKLGEVVTASTTLLGDTSGDGTNARVYTFGAVATPLVVNAGSYSGSINVPVSLTPSITGGVAPYTCSWTGTGATFTNAASCNTAVTLGSAGSHTLTLTVTDNAATVVASDATVNIAGASGERVELSVGGALKATVPTSTSAQNPTATWMTSVDLSGYSGATTILATWYDADNSVLATKTVTVNVGGVSGAFVRIDSPSDDPSGATPHTGSITVSGEAGHGSGGIPAGLNAFGFPITSGARGGLRAPVALEGDITAFCAGCQGAPQNQLSGDNGLSTSVTWQLGEEANGVDGYWFNIAGLGGSTYALSAEFGSPMDIFFFKDWTDAASVGKNQGPADTKSGTVPSNAGYAFVYMRRVTQGGVTALESVFDTAKLTLTPQIVAPSAPQNVQALAGNAQVALAWGAPANDGGELLGYKIYQNGALIATQTSNMLVVTGLTNGVSYSFEVEAYNSKGATKAPAVVATPSAVGPGNDLAITSPANGATGVSTTPTITGTYKPATTTVNSGNFANTHYFVLFNLNDGGCGDPLGYGDHVIAEKLIKNAREKLGVPAENIHIFNEKNVALTRATDAANFDKLSPEWRSGSMFDGKGTLTAMMPAFTAAMGQAAASENAGGAPARVFLIHSSHGLWWPAPLNERVFGSMMCLNGEDVTDREFGDAITGALDAAEAANPGVTIEVAINIDCSFCGGFGDSPLWVPGTTVTEVDSANVVGPNRVVEVGCTWITECFGNPAVTYDHMYNECTFNGKADGFGPAIVTGQNGTTGGDAGNDFTIADANHHAKDGVITFEEAYWCALQSVISLGTLDPIGIQQMFQIIDNMPTDMFGLDGFILYDFAGNLDLGSRDLATPLANQQLPAIKSAASDPTGDAQTAYGDLVLIDASIVGSNVVVELTVADLSHTVEFEDVVAYGFHLNGQEFEICYDLGAIFVWDYGNSAVSGGTAVYDVPNNKITATLPLSELVDGATPVQVFATSGYGPCALGAAVPDDRIPNAGTIATSSGNNGGGGTGTEEIRLTLTGPGATVINAIATLNATTKTWAYTPASALASGAWSVSAEHWNDPGSGAVKREGPVSVSFTVGSGGDITPPTAPQNLRVTGTTSSSIALAWDAATDNVGVTGYDIYRGAALVGTTANLVFTNTGLPAETAYTYTVKARDAANNLGPASNAVIGTTDAIETGLGTITLKVDGQVVGTTSVDTSQNDPAAWSIILDTDAFSAGAHALRVEYDDGQGDTASHIITIHTGVQHEISITSPTHGATVTPDFTVTGTTVGSGGPSMPARGSYVLPDGTIDPTHIGFKLAATGALTTLDNAFKNAAGYTGISPDLEGAPVIRVYFTGAAPSDMHEDLVPAGWTIEAVENVGFTRARVKYDLVIDTTSAPREGPPTPAQKSKIGPGSHILMTMAGGTYGCTANFIWKDESTGKYYLGAAGHCFLPEDKTATHGPGADYNRLLTSVRVCTAGCTNGGQTGFVITGTMTPLGNVAYARQTLNGADVGNDFGIVEIPASLYSMVDPRMPIWNGPSKEGTQTIGAPSLLYGNAAVFGEVWPTMARAGFGSVFGNANYWSAVIASAPGDSGSALVKGVTSTNTNVINGVDAIGALTHLSGGGPVVGTTMTRAKAMANEAGITIRLVTETEIVTGTGPVAPGVPTLTTTTAGDGQVIVDWTAPTSDGGSPITGYTVKYGTASGTYTLTKPAGTGLSTAVTGLTNGQAYFFVVTATNAVGTSANSNERTATPSSSSTVPAAPANLQAVAGNMTVTLGWNAPNNGGSPITSYTVSYGTSSGTYTSSKTVAGTNAVITSLTNDVTYFFAVRATNVNGDSAFSNEVSATPEAAPVSAYKVQVRVAGGAWQDAAFDGSNWALDVTGAPVGAATIDARLLKDGSGVATDSIIVTVEAVNRPPVASAAGPGTVDEGTAVTLDGTASSDPDAGDSLTYAWTQISGPTAQLAGATTATASFTAPNVNANTTLHFRLTVTDVAGAQDSDDVLVEVRDLTYFTLDTVNGQPAQSGMTVSGVANIAGRGHIANSGTQGPNTPPVAVISNPVITGRSITASGANSFDPDGTIVVHSWDLGNGQTASGAALAYTYPADGSYTMTLTVIDNRGAFDQVTFGPYAITDTPVGTFVVNAGDSKFVQQGKTADLTAESFGADGAVTYTWDLNGDDIGDVAGQAISINTTGMPIGSKTFKVIATDGQNTRATDTVKIYVHGLTTEPKVFSNTVLAALPDEDAGASGAVDGATFHHPVTVTNSAALLDAMLVWDVYAGVVPENPVGFVGGPNDFDLFAWSPGGEQDKSSADFKRPESLSVASPVAGTWDFEVRGYVVANDKYTLFVNLTQAPSNPMPVVSMLNDFCFETGSQLLQASATGGGVTGAWDLDLDGTFETSGMSTTTNFPVGSGAHLVRFRATDDSGFRTTQTFAFRVDATCVGAPSVVVIAIADTGINPYAKEFEGRYFPYPALAEYTKVDLANPGPKDVIKTNAGAALPFTRHPSTYIPGFPADARALNLTLGAQNKNLDSAVWTKSNIPLNTWFWIPGTKIIGAIDGSDIAAVNAAADSTPIFDDDGHGTGSASVAAGNTVGACPRCVIVFAEGLSSDTAFFDHKWIDFVSVSGGSPANIGTPGLGIIDFEAQTRTAAERGQTISYAAGNGNENMFLTPQNTYTSNSLGPDWTINVGAVSATNNAAHTGTGKPVDWSAFGSGSIPKACHNAYTCTGSFSGTSAATPISTGHLGNILLNARIAMGDLDAGQKSASAANGQRQAIAVGKAVAASPWLNDGVLTRAELWNVGFHCASSFGTSVGLSSGAPIVGATAADFAYGGYGVADTAMATCATSKLLTGGALKATANADQFFAIDERIRDALWGDWDGNGNGQKGGSFTASTSPVTLPRAITRADVDTLDKASALLREIAEFNNFALSIPASETYYVHRDACGGTGDNSLYADRTAKASAEGGNGCSSLGATATNNAWTSRVPTANSFATGSTVTANIRAFALRPTPDVVMTGTLLVDGVAIGSGASAPVTVVSVGLVTTPCHEWAITFPTTADIAAGATVTFRVTTPVGTQDLPMCYEGGPSSSRFVINGPSGGGGGGETPTANITSPAQGAELDKSTGSVTVSGTATFPAQSALQKVYLRRDSCVNLNSDTLYLSPVDGADAGNGCALTAGAAAPAQNFVEKYNLIASELPIVLGAGSIVSGTVYFNTQGADPAQVEFRVQSSEGLVGKQLAEVVYASVGGVPGAAAVNVAIPVGASVAGKTLTSLTFEIALLRQGAVHWTELDNPASFVELPRLGGPAGSAVEVSIDDPGFTSGTLTVSGTNTWSATWDISNVADGAHTIYARAKTSQSTGPMTSIGVTVAGGSTGGTGSGSVQVQFTQAAAPDANGWLAAAFNAAGESWNYGWDTSMLANGPWNFHARLVNDAGVEQQTSVLPVTLANSRAPVLATIGPKTVNENATLEFTVSATDLDGDALVFSMTGAPSGATLTQVDATSAIFRWTPGFDAAGSYAPTITVTANGDSDSEQVSITVNNVNRPPVLDAVPAKTVNENATLAFTLSATDPDMGESLTYSMTGAPTGARLNAQTGAFSWKPTFDDAGEYSFTARVTDGSGATSSQAITITVVNVNRAPVMNAISDKTVDEKQTLTFTVSASDPDGQPVTYTASEMPAGATFNANTRTFSWTPTLDQAGNYTVKFTASDGDLSDAKNAKITVVNVPGAARDAMTGSEYETVQQAIDAGQSGATILVRAGATSEALVLRKTGVSLCSSTMMAPFTCDGSPATHTLAKAVTVSASGVTVQGFTILAPNGGVGVQGSGTVTGLVVRGNVIRPVDGAIGESGVDVRFTNGRVEGNTISGFANAVFLRPYTMGTIVEANTISASSQGVTSYGMRSYIANNTFQGVGTGVDVKEIDRLEDPTGDVDYVVLRGNHFGGAVYGVRVGSDPADVGITVDARLNDWGVYESRLVAMRYQANGEGNRVLAVPFLAANGASEPALVNVATPASHTSSPAVCNALDSDADGVPDAFYAGGQCNFLTVQAAIMAAHAGGIIAIPMSESIEPTPRNEAITIGVNSHGEALNELTICSTVVVGKCAPESLGARWSTNGVWGAPPVPHQGQAIKLNGASGSTSLFLGDFNKVSTVQVRDITELGIDMLLESGACGAGSPRITLRIDTDNDGTADLNKHVYPSGFTCTVGKWVHVDFTASTNWGNIPGMSQAAFHNSLPSNHRIISMNLIVDGSPVATTIWVDNQAFNGAYFRESVDTQCFDKQLPTCTSLSSRAATILDAMGAAPSTIGITAMNATVRDLTIRNTGVTSGQAILAGGNQVTIANNAILGTRMMDGTKDTEFGVLLAGSGIATVRGNTITGWENLGLYLGGSHSGNVVIANNEIKHNDQGVRLEGQRPAATVDLTANVITNNVASGIVLDTDRAVTMRENDLGPNGNTLAFTTRFAGHTIDARANHWGVVGRNVIAATISDPANHNVRTMPYLDAEGLYHPPQPTLQCAVNTLPNVGGTPIIPLKFLDIQDALAATCPANYPVHRIQVFADVESYEPSIVSVPAYIRASGYGGIGGRIEAQGFAKPALTFLNGSINSKVEGLVLAADAGETGIKVDLAGGSDFVSIYENTFVGTGTGIDAKNGRGPSVSYNRFTGLDVAVSYTKVQGGLISDSVIVAGPEPGAYADAAIVVVDSHDVKIWGSKIDLMPIEDQPSYGIRVHNSTQMELLGNVVKGSGTDPSSIGLSLRDVTTATVKNSLVTGSTIGIYARTSQGITYTDNRIVGAPEAVGSRGIDIYLGSGHTLVGNTFAGVTTGLAVHGTPNVNVERLAVTGAVTGVRLSATGVAPAYTQATNFVMHNATLGGAATGLHLASTTFGLNVAATCNDWGAYTAATVPTRIKNEGYGNSVSHTPYTSAESSGVGCLRVPAANFTATPNPAARSQAIQFTDTTASGSRPVVSRAWDFGDSTSSTSQNPAHAYALVGSYLVKLTVTDLDGVTSSHLATIVVQNAAPVLAPIGPKAVSESSTLSFTVSATDADGDTLTYSATDLPAGATFSARTFSWTPGPTQAGTYPVTFSVTDGLDTATETIVITVREFNRAPTLDAISAKVVAEGTKLTFVITGSDPDGDTLAYSATGLPAGAMFDAATRRFTWTPTYAQAGSYSVRFTVTDGSLSANRDVSIRVDDVQRPPALDAIGGKLTFEGAALVFNVRAVDPEGDAITLATSTLPQGATFVDHSDGTGTFTWTPAKFQAGSYNITFEARDATAYATEIVTIRVSPTTGVPAFEPLGTRTTRETEKVSFFVNAYDPDGDQLTYSVSGLPTGATFSTTTRKFSWTPSYEQAGTHAITFRVSDSTTIVSEVATIIVENVNRAPIVQGATAATLVANRTAAIAVPFADPDGTKPVVTPGILPAGATFDAATSRIIWRPAPGQEGMYTVDLVADDGEYSVAAAMTLTVIANAVPTLTATGPAQVDVLQKVFFVGNATDPDGTTAPTIVWDFDARDGFQAQATGKNVNYTYTAVGTYTVTVRATDADGMTTTRTFEVNVDDIIVLTVDITPDTISTTAAATGTVRVEDQDGVPQVGATVTLDVFWNPNGNQKSLVRTITVVTGADGKAAFVIPTDTVLANYLGKHIVDGRASVANSLNGDTETATGSDTYTVTP